MVFQAYALFPNMTVGTISLWIKTRQKAGRGDQAARGRNAQSDPHAGAGRPLPVPSFAGGQQQRVALARAGDSPGSAVARRAALGARRENRVSLRAEIRAIQQQLGITAIYVTHDQEEALSISTALW